MNDFYRPVDVSSGDSVFLFSHLRTSTLENKAPDKNHDQMAR